MLKASEVSKTYRVGGRSVEALRPTSLVLEPGTVTAVVGRSGSGKTTLLNIMAGLLRPTSGSVTLDGQDLFALSDRSLSDLRGRCLGVVVQGQSLVQSLTVRQNVLLALSVAGGSHGPVPVDEEEDGVEELLARLGLSELAEALPKELSGGEARRVAVARALACRPAYLLADEPTSNLDERSAAAVTSSLAEAARDGAGVLLVTHDLASTSIAGKVLTMRDGRV